MHRNEPTTIWSRVAVCAVGVCAAVTLAACGGSDEGDAVPATTQAGGETTEAAPAGETPASEASGDLKGCLEAAGFTVQDGSTPAEILESLGVEQQLRLVGPDEGMGSVTVYASMDAAEEGLASETATETEGVAIAMVDNAVYTYTGDFDSEAAIDRCLR